MEILKMAVLLCKTDGFCMGVDPKIDPESVKIWFRAPSCPSCFSPRYQNGSSEHHKWAFGGRMELKTAGGKGRNP